MAKHCETFEHTADVGLAGWADTPGELFEALADELADVICPRRQVSGEIPRDISADAEDIEALAVDFLTEVMNVILTDRFVLSAVSVATMTDVHIDAKLLGERYDPARHEISTEVKAVTYHQLKIALDGDKWIGRVILDV